MPFCVSNTDSQVPDVKDDRHGGMLVAHVLRAHGVKFVFTLCGGHISPILVGCKAAGIRIIDTRHEATAVFAAEGVCACFFTYFLELSSF